MPMTRPILTGLRGTKITGSISYVLVTLINDKDGSLAYVSAPVGLAQRLPS
jgi:hypothetical protein